MAEKLIIFTTGVLVGLGLFLAIWSLFAKKRYQPDYNGHDDNGYQPLKSLEEIATLTPKQQIDFIRQLDEKLAGKLAKTDR